MRVRRPRRVAPFPHRTCRCVPYGHTYDCSNNKLSDSCTSRMYVSSFSALLSLSLYSRNKFRKITDEHKGKRNRAAARGNNYWCLSDYAHWLLLLPLQLSLCILVCNFDSMPICLSLTRYEYQRAVQPVSVRGWVCCVQSIIKLLACVDAAVF